MYVTFRPLPVWPHKATTSRRPSQFKTSYPRTLELLEREIGFLGGRDVVMGVGLSERDVRLDGQPRANARAMGHPGVEITFASRYGPQSFSTDEFDDWQDNVRAIALSLEALRSVERYGVSKGRQYVGFAQITAGGPDPVRGKALLERAGGKIPALKAHHPDAGGEERDFVDVMAYVKEAGL